MTGLIHLEAMNDFPDVKEQLYQISAKLQNILNDYFGHDH